VIVPVKVIPVVPQVVKPPDEDVILNEGTFSEVILMEATAVQLLASVPFTV
jgi:hypothetical protein